GPPDHGYHGDRRNARGQRHRHLPDPRDFLHGGEIVGRESSQPESSAHAGARRLNMKHSFVVVAIAAGLLTSCTVGPNYARPTVPVPVNFRAPDPLPAPQAESLADLKW